MSSGKLKVVGENQQHKVGFKDREIRPEMFEMKLEQWGRSKGPLLFERTHEASKWLQQQKKSGLWLYERAMLTGPSTQVLAIDDSNSVIYGINFASTDYLGLSQHQLTKEEAIKATIEFGCNSAGSPLAFGATKYYRQLREEIADFWKIKSVMIYSAGWLAGYGVFRGLLKEWDHVIMDEDTHNCMKQGASAVTSNIYKFKHLDQNAMQAKLKQVREKDPGNSIMVVTEGLFYMDALSPNLVQYQRITKKYNAYLLINCANDFGCMGPNGKGVWQAQGLKDRSNVLFMGSGSKTLAVNLGFLACEDEFVIEYMKILSSTYMFTNAINPIQASTALTNLRMISGEHGKNLRKEVMSNYTYIKGKLEEKGYKIYGQPCPALPLHIGNEILCRLVVRDMMDLGIHVNCVEYPAVPVGQARIMVNLMAQHTHYHMDKFVSTFEKCLAHSQQILDRLTANGKGPTPAAKL